MRSVELRLLTVGLATIQDLGRPGLAHLGVAENGASDGWAAQVANVLAGNPPDEPLVEITGSELTFTANTDVLLSLTGSAAHVLVGGAPQAAWETLVVAAGTRVTIPAPQVGLRSYLALNGRIDAPSVLGSVAPDRLLGTGRTLRAGDVVTVRSTFAGLDHPYLGIPVFRMGAHRPLMPQPLLVETTPGPDTNEFPDVDRRGLSGEYEVSIQSDAIGLRLLGPTPRRVTSHEILSRGVPVGAIEIPPAGGLLLLLRGRLVTAGYPVVAVATLASIDQLGQARAGDRVRFVLVDAHRARQTHRQRIRELDTLASRVRNALTSVGLDHTPHPQEQTS